MFVDETFFLFQQRIKVLYIDHCLVVFSKENLIVFVADEDLLELKNSKGKHAQFLSDMCKFYRDFHAEHDDIHGTGN